MAEINFIRGLYFFVLIVELGISYWPFVGYTTRPHGLLMAGTGHCITGIILLSCIALWESGMLKAYPSTTLELTNPILDEIAQGLVPLIFDVILNTNSRQISETLVLANNHAICCLGIGHYLHYQRILCISLLLSSQLRP